MVAGQVKLCHGLAYIAEDDTTLQRYPLFDPSESFSNLKVYARRPFLTSLIALSLHLTPACHGSLLLFIGRSLDVHQDRTSVSIFP